MMSPEAREVEARELRVTLDKLRSQARALEVAHSEASAALRALTGGVGKSGGGNEEDEGDGEEEPRTTHHKKRKHRPPPAPSDLLYITDADV